MAQSNRPSQTNTPRKAEDSEAPYVRLGLIVAPHGIRGEVRVKTFTAEPEDLLNYEWLHSGRPGSQFKIKRLMAKGDTLAIVSLKDVSNRNQAEALCGTFLCVDRNQLKDLGDEEFYHTDLVGLHVFTTTQLKVGVIRAVHNFGAGDILEIKLDDTGSLMVPFLKDAVPHLDLEEGFIIIDEVLLASLKNRSTTSKGRSSENGPDDDESQH